MYTRVSLLLPLLSFLALPLLARAEEAPKLTIKKGDRIVFLGDSITAGGVSPHGYVTVIKNTLGSKAHVTIIGAGISGNKVPDLQARLKRDVLDKKPTLVVIYIGINDVWHGQDDPKRGTSKEKYEEGLKDVIQQIQKAGAKVLVCTPTVIGEKTGGKNKNDARLDEYAAMSRKVAKELKVPVCDLRKAFTDYLKKNNKDDKDRGILTSDSVHLSDAGNKLVAETILKSLGQ